MLLCYERRAGVGAATTLLRVVGFQALDALEGRNLEVSMPPFPIFPAHVPRLGELLVPSPCLGQAAVSLGKPAVRQSRVSRLLGPTHRLEQTGQLSRGPQ